MDIAIIGAGSMGLLWAWRLQRAGHAVHLICRNTSSILTLREGITVEYRGASERFTVSTSTDMSTIRNSSYIFLWVKAYATREAALSIAPFLHDNQALVTLQNGLGNPACLAKTCPGSEIFAGTTTAAAYLDTNRLLVSSLGETKLGLFSRNNEGQKANHSASSGNDALAQPAKHANPDALAEILCHAGLSTTVCEDVEQSIWEKASINAAINPLSALLRVKNGELGTNRVALDLQAAVIDEAVKVAASQGIALDARKLSRKIQDICRSTSTNISSMLADVQRGKKTEIDALNGSIAAIAEQHGIETPVNRFLTMLIRALEVSKS